MRPIQTLDEFMDASAENGVTFRLDATKNGIAYSVGYPHSMSNELRGELIAWAAAHREELSDFLFNMADDIKNGATGTTIITVDVDHSGETKH
jgi:hypothetical protein